MSYLTEKFCFKLQHVNNFVKREGVHVVVSAMQRSLLFSYTVLEWLKYKTAKPLLYTVYKTKNRKQLGRK